MPTHALDPSRTCTSGPTPGARPRRSLRWRALLALAALAHVAGCQVGPSNEDEPVAPTLPAPTSSSVPTTVAGTDSASVDGTDSASVAGTDSASVAGASSGAAPEAEASATARVESATDVAGLDWRSALSALVEATGAERVAAITSLAEALPAAIADLRSESAVTSDATRAERLEGLARFAERTRAALLNLLRQDRAAAATLQRVEREERTARERHRLALAERAQPPTTPVYPELPLAEAQLTLTRELRELEAEHARLVEERGRAAAPAAATIPPDAPARAERVSEQLSQALPDLAALARGLALATQAAAADGEALDARLPALERRERDAHRLREEAVSLEVERRRRRLEELGRLVREQQLRAEESARLARRDDELAGQIARLEAALAQDLEARRAAEAQTAAVLSRTDALAAAPGGEALRTYRATLGEYQRRLEAAAQRAEAARGDLQALGAQLEAEAAGGAPESWRDQIDRARRAWERRRDARQLEELVVRLEAARRDDAQAALDLRARADEARRRGTEALEAAMRLEAEAARQAVFVRGAPAEHFPLLSAIEQVRSLLEAARRSEGQLRLDLARAVSEAAQRRERDGEAVVAAQDEVRAAAKAARDARRLDAGSLREAWVELREAWISRRAEAEERLAALRADGDARWRAACTVAGALAVLAGALVIAARARRRARAIALAGVDEARRLPRAADRHAFVGAWLLAATAGWLGLVCAVLLAVAGLGFPVEGPAGLAPALAVILAWRALRGVIDLLLGGGPVRPFVEAIGDHNRVPIHARLRAALALATPLLAGWALVRDEPAMWSTAVVLRLALSLLVVAALAAVLHVAREEVAARLRLPEPAPGERRTLVDWVRSAFNRIVEQLLFLLLLDGLVVGALWVAGWAEPAAFLLRGTVLTILTVAGALLLVALLRRINRRLVESTSGAEPARPGLQIAIGMLAFLACRVAEVTLTASACVAIYAAWGGDVRPVLDVVASERVRGGAVAVVKVLAILAAAYYLNRLAGYTIDTFIDQTLRTAARDLARRRDTFAPLAKSAVRYVVSIAAIIYAATVAGLDLLSVMAGLGVIGLAVAFGAQALVKDVITGVFLIMDDVIAVGDVVKIGDVDGFVEHVGVRVVTLRNEAGVVISVPNGSIERVHNFNRGWNRALVNMDVAYGTNVERAMAVLKEVADEYRRQRPDLVLEAPEVQGILECADSSIVIKLRARTAPLAVWQVERELRLRAVVAFEEQGIEIPWATQVVHMKLEPNAAAAAQAMVAATSQVAPPAGTASPQVLTATGQPASALISGTQPTGARPQPAVAQPAGTPPQPAAAQPTSALILPAPAQSALILPAAAQPASALILPAAAQPAGGLPQPTAAQPAIVLPAGVAAAPAAPPHGVEPAALLVTPDGASERRDPDLVTAPAEAAAEGPRLTRRIVLSDEARARLRDDAYVQAVATASEPIVPTEVADSNAIIERHRQGAEQGAPSAGAALAAGAAGAAPSAAAAPPAGAAPSAAAAPAAGAAPPAAAAPAAGAAPPAASHAPPAAAETAPARTEHAPGAAPTPSGAGPRTEGASSPPDGPSDEPAAPPDAPAYPRAPVG